MHVQRRINLFQELHKQMAKQPHSGEEDYRTETIETLTIDQNSGSRFMLNTNSARTTASFDAPLQTAKESYLLTWKPQYKKILFTPKSKTHPN